MSIVLRFGPIFFYLFVRNFITKDFMKVIKQILLFLALGLILAVLSPLKYHEFLGAHMKKNNSLEPYEQRRDFTKSTEPKEPYTRNLPQIYLYLSYKTCGKSSTLRFPPRN